MGVSDLPEFLGWLLTQCVCFRLQLVRQNVSLWLLLQRPSVESDRSCLQALEQLAATPGRRVSQLLPEQRRMEGKMILQLAQWMAETGQGDDAQISRESGHPSACQAHHIVAH